MSDDQRREAWKAERDELRAKGKSGASEVAAAAGVSPYMTQLERYRLDSGGEPLAVPEELFRWGHLNQPTILAEYARESGRTLIDHGDYTIQQNPLYPAWFCTLDAGVEGYTGSFGPGCVDAKNVGHYMGDRWDGGVPIEVEAQLQVQMAAMGYNWASAAALIGGNRFVWCDIERSDKQIDWLHARTVEHWQRVRAGKPPPATKKDAATLLAMFPKHTPGKIVQVDAEGALDFIGHTLWKAREAAAENAVEAHRAYILQAAGDAEIVELPDGTRYSVKSQTRKAYEVKESTSRVIRKMKGDRS